MKLINKKNLHLNIIPSQSPYQTSGKCYVSPAPSYAQSQNNQQSGSVQNKNHKLSCLLKPLDNSPAKCDIQPLNTQQATNHQTKRHINKTGNHSLDIEEQQETEKEPYCSGLNKLSTASASPSQNPRSNISFLKDNITQVAAGIYLGNYRCAMDKDKINRFGISHVINCSPSDCQNLFADELIYLNIAIQDNWKTNLFLVIYAILDFLNQALKAGGNVLIHCNQGISRSPSVVIAYLIYTEKITATEALRKLKTKYPSADPNLDFQLQLNEMYIEATSKQPESSQNSSRPLCPIDHLHNTQQINHHSSVVTLTTPKFSKQPFYYDSYINRTKQFSPENIFQKSQDKLNQTQGTNQDNLSSLDISETFNSVNTSMSSNCDSNTTELNHFAQQDIEIQ